MNTPIISPIWFYLMGVVDGLSILAVILVFALVATVIFLSISYATEKEDLKWAGTFNREKHELKVGMYFEILKKSIISLVISSLVLVFIPSQDTMMKMLIAQNITYERVEGGKEMVKDTVDYIFEKINESKEGEK